MTTPSELSFEILVKANSREASTPVARPSPEHLERIRRVLTNRGIRCHVTPLLLVCYSSPSVFEATFGVRLRPTSGGPSEPPFIIEGVPTPPADIADLIEQVTIPGAPELY